MSFGGFIGNLISGGGSGGYGDWANEIQQGINSLNTQYGAGQKVLQPWESQGLNAFGQYGQAINGMSNPGQFYNNIMSQYQQSPAAQLQMQQGTLAANNAAAAGGMLGSGAAQKGMINYANQVTNSDMQNYFNNQMGIQGQYLGGLQNQFGTGFDAAGQLNNNYMNLGNQLAQQYGNMGAAQYGGNTSSYGGMDSLMGMFGGSSFGQGLFGDASNWLGGMFGGGGGGSAGAIASGGDPGGIGAFASSMFGG